MRRFVRRPQLLEISRGIVSKQVHIAHRCIESLARDDHEPADADHRTFLETVRRRGTLLGLEVQERGHRHTLLALVATKLRADVQTAEVRAVLGGLGQVHFAFFVCLLRALLVPALGLVYVRRVVVRRIVLARCADERDARLRQLSFLADDQVPVRLVRLEDVPLGNLMHDREDRMIRRETARLCHLQRILRVAAAIEQFAVLSGDALPGLVFTTLHLGFVRLDPLGERLAFRTEPLQLRAIFLLGGMAKYAFLQPLLAPREVGIQQDEESAEQPASRRRTGRTHASGEKEQEPPGRNEHESARHQAVHRRHEDIQTRSILVPLIQLFFDPSHEPPPAQRERTICSCCSARYVSKYHPTRQSRVVTNTSPSFTLSGVMPSIHTSKKSSATPPLPAWNLSDLFSSITDPAVDKHLATSLKAAQQLQKTYKGKIAQLAKKPALLAKAIRLYESQLEAYAKPQIYAALVHSADSSRPENGAFMQRVGVASLEISKYFLFFELELGALPKKTTEKLLKAKELANYHHFLGRLDAYQPHRLDEVREQLINDLSLTSAGAFARLYEEEHSRRTYPLKQGKTEKVVGKEELLHGLQSEDRNVRKTAADTLTAGLKDQSHRLTFITNTLLQHKRTLDRYRRFATPETAQHLANETDQKTVDAMSEAITKHYPLVARDYRFKKNLLGLDTLYDYDRYAPLPKTETTFTFDQAKGIILEAFGRFSPEFATLAEEFFTKGWIDAALRPGKRGGAFCMFNTTDLHPYVLVNFNGGIKDVMTLGHELGHAVHACLARQQTYLNFDMPLTFAETASVFAEMLVFDALRERITDPREKLTLYLMKIEEMFATVFRQTAMYRFEQDLHALGKEQGELTTEIISQRWLVRQREMFGTSVTLRDDYGIWWNYISHFIESPFYVYSYAFGEILTLSLFAQYQAQGETLTEKYTQMLSAGGSRTPEQQLKPFGIDLRKTAFWEQGIGYVEALVNEAIALEKKTRTKPSRHSR